MNQSALNREQLEIYLDRVKVKAGQANLELYECLQIKFGLTYTKDESDQLYAMALNWQTK